MDFTSSLYTFQNLKIVEKIATIFSTFKKKSINGKSCKSVL